MYKEAKAEEKFGIIEEAMSGNEKVLKINALCRVAGVSRSGYYKWKSRAAYREEREEQDRRDFDKIAEAYAFRGFDKGARGLYMRILHTGTVMNIKRIRRLMRKYGLSCPIRKPNPYRRMAKDMATKNTADNLLNREFHLHGARTVMLTDITYLIYNGEKSYLSVITDAYTNQALAYRLSSSLELDFVLETVSALIENHGKELKAKTLLHSDQGCHYTSYRFIDLLHNSNLTRSMSRKATCWDNAPQESFFGHMNDEVDISKCKTYEEVSDRIKDWIDYYNNDRYQWQLAKLSPNEFYEYTVSGKYPLDSRANDVSGGRTSLSGNRSGAKRNGDSLKETKNNEDTVNSYLILPLIRLVQKQD